MPAAGEDAKFAVFGALDYASGNVLWRTAGRKDGAAFVAFLDHLAEELPSGLRVVVLNNVGYHKGPLAKAWRMAHQDRIRPLWLPAYTPELNLIERVWRHLKGKLACHRYWSDRDGLEQVTATLLDRLEARFHQPGEPSIRLAHNFCQTA